jgi:hypothetical protein
MLLSRLRREDHDAVNHRRQEHPALLGVGQHPLAFSGEHSRFAPQEVVTGALEKRCGDVLLGSSGIDAPRSTDGNRLGLRAPVAARQTSPSCCVIRARAGCSHRSGSVPLIAVWGLRGTPHCQVPLFASSLAMRDWPAPSAYRLNTKRTTLARGEMERIHSR